MNKVCSVLLISTSLLCAADWPQWRGPNRDDISPDTGLLKQWPATGPRLLWKASGLGRGFSTVSVVKDHIYTAGDNEGASYVFALDSNGKQVWSSKLGKAGQHGGYFGPRGEPTIDGDFVYMLGQFGELVCYEAASGKEVWRKNLKDDFDGQPGGWGYSEAVVVDGDNVICTPGGSKGALLALNKKTGAQVWRTAEIKDEAQYVSVVPATIAGVKQYVQMTGNTLFGVTPDGKVLWRAKRVGSTATIPTPIVYKDHIYVTSGYGIGCNCFKVTKTGNSFKAEQIYSNKDMINHHGGVVRVGEYLYGHSDRGDWTCQKFDNGEVVWKNAGVGKGSVTYADGQLYLRSEGGAGKVALIDATPAGYKEHGRFDQPERSKDRSWPHPVVIGGRLYLRDQQTLLCYDVKNLDL